MRKLILYILTLLPFFALAQNTTNLPAGTSPTGINIRLLNSPNPLKQWWFQTTLDNKYNRFLSATENYAYFFTRAQVDSIAALRAKLNGDNEFNGTQKVNDIRPIDFNSYGYGYVDYVSASNYSLGARAGYGFHNFGVVGLKMYTNSRSDLLHLMVDDGNDYTVWHSGNLKLGTPGQSVRVNSAGTGFEAYTPASPATPNLQSVATAGNTSTIPLDIPYLTVNSQSSNLPNPGVGKFNLGVVNNAFTYLNGTNGVQRRIVFPITITDATARMPYKTTFTLADSADVVRRAGDKMTGDLSIENNGTPSLNLSNNVSGSKTTLSQSATNNKFSLNVSAKPAGGIGGALSLSSASSQSVTMTNSIPTGAAPFSIGSWIQRTGGTNRYVFANNTTTAGQQIYLQINASGSYILTHSGTTFFGSVSDAQYFHFFYTFNGTQGKLFINGVISAGAQTVSSPNIGSGTLILGRSALNAQFGDFNLDQFIIYSSALTDAQVISIYNMGAGTPSIPTLNLVRRFDFETSGTLLLDGVSGTNATGTNSPAYTPAGKVALSTAGALAVNEIVTTKDGQTQAEPIIVNVGGETFTQTVNMNGRFNGIQTSKGYSLQGGPNGWLAFANGLIDNRDINGNTALYGMTFYPGNSTTEGHQHWISANTLPNPSTARIGVHTWSGSRMNVITSSTTTSQYAYTSDLTQIFEIANGTTTQQASANTIYIPHGTAKTTITLPLDANAPVGTLIQVVGEGSGGWRIGQNAGQFIVGIGTFSTTVGTAGYVESSEANCTITLRKTLTNKWTITSSQGTINRN